jgi:hypothetical protein
MEQVTTAKTKSKESFATIFWAADVEILVCLAPIYPGLKVTAEN